MTDHDETVVEPDDVTQPDDNDTDAPTEDSRVVETALAERSASQALIDRLTFLDNAEALLKRFMQNLHTLRVLAIKATEPQQWVLFRDQRGAVFAYPNEKACSIMRAPYKIAVQLRPVNANGDFEPEEIKIEGSQLVEWRGWANAQSATLGPEHDLVDVPFARYSDEDFVGRKLVRGGQGGDRLRIKRGTLKSGEEIAGVLPGDIRSACASLGRSKCTRIITGTAATSLDTLREAWQGTPKRIDDCRGGSGYGSAASRASDDVSGDDLKTAREKLRDDILRRVGGDKVAARDLLRECSAFEGRNGPVKGVTEISKLASIGRVNGTWRSLREHPTFGDHRCDR